LGQSGLTFDILEAQDGSHLMPTSSILYTFGFLLVVGGLAYAAHLAGLPSPWIIAGVIVLIGIFLLRLARKPQKPSNLS
jgi:hypothetical protein